MIKTYIVTPEKLYKEVEAHQVVLPGIEGEFGLLPGHVDFSSNLVDGVVRFLDQSEKEVEVLSFKDGICEFSDDICRVIVKSAA